MYLFMFRVFIIVNTMFFFFNKIPITYINKKINRKLIALTLYFSWRNAAAVTKYMVLDFKYVYKPF